MIGNIIAAIVIGIIAGYLGRALLPGDDSMGFVATVITGIVGALVGWVLFTYLLGIGDEDKFDLGGILGSRPTPIVPVEKLMITSPASALIASVIAQKSSISYDGTPSGVRAWMWIIAAPSSTARRASAPYSAGV